LKKKESFNFFANRQEKFAQSNGISELSTGQVYTLNHIACFFHVTLRTIYNWRDRGILPCTVIGSKTYLTEAQLQEFLKNHEVKPVYNGRLR
jgi:hypothetical protein